MIRLGFGSIPTKVVVRLGRHSNLVHNTVPLSRQTRSVSCLWDEKLRRPRRLKLITRRTGLPIPPVSNGHGRYLHT